MKIYDNIEQGTDEWLKLKIGMVGGTSLGSLMGSLTNKTSLKAMDSLFFRILAERDTGLRKDSVKSPSMERGNDEEENTQDHFEIASGLSVTNVGFITNDEFSMVGLSPDGIIYDDNGLITQAVEYKNPNSDTHLKYLFGLTGLQGYGDISAGFENSIPFEYYWQCIHYFVVINDLVELHFMSHDERSNSRKNVLSSLRREDVLDDIALAKERLHMFEAKIKEAELILLET